MNKMQELAALGQAIWLDYIRRAFITSGELQALVEAGLRGVTANPSILEKAIAGSRDYDDDIHRLVEAGQPAEAIYEALAIADMRAAADALAPVYQATAGADGYISLEVNPLLANDTAGTIAEARRLFAALSRPNVMIKVPATPAGIPAIQALIAEGINVNVTLIFSLAHYEAAAQAYIAGLEQRAVQGLDLARLASVASFFVSRVDTLIDQELERRGERELQGKIAIANCKLAYARFRALFAGARWQRLAQRGAQLQRVLWASTGVKNPLYPDTLYVDNLIGPHTVNTLPPATLQAFLDHGRVAPTLEAGLEQAQAQIGRLRQLGIDLDATTEQLQTEGVAAFKRSFETLMASIAAKREALLAGRAHRWAELGPYAPAVQAALDEMERAQIVRRIWACDHTVWRPEPTEISNRLGWLRAPEMMRENLGRLQALTDALRAEGYTDALLLGMGGSSLAPEVFRKTFGVRAGFLDLAVLDSTTPDAVLAQAGRLDPTRTLFIVSTKSGGTVETLSFFKYFYNWVVERLGPARAGEHFIAITDAGSAVAALAERYHFRAALLNDPNIGGRYSALSHFGLAPAALAGVDVGRLLDRALTVACSSEACVAVANNPSAWLGAIMGELAKAGRDKLTLVLSPAIASFGDWIEQLVAESTGKEGKGILPVVGEAPGRPAVYGADRLFVHLRLQDDATHDATLEALEKAGQPLLRLHLHDAYDLGGQFFLWELATAIAGHRLGIQPFDQPNVEAAKALARRLIAEYQKAGALPAGQTAPLSAETLHAFLAAARPGDYVALQAYVPPTPAAAVALDELRTAIRDRYRLATTLGYGPRFLHSTGQLHKGDAGNGLFVQFTYDPAADAPIPDEAGRPAASMTFGVLNRAQALGDAQALRDAGRRLICFHLGADVAGGLRRLLE